MTKTHNTNETSQYNRVSLWTKLNGGLIALTVISVLSVLLTYYSGGRVAGLAGEQQKLADALREAHAARSLLADASFFEEARAIEPGRAASSLLLKIDAAKRHLRRSGLAEQALAELARPPAVLFSLEVGDKKAAAEIGKWNGRVHAALEAGIGGAEKDLKRVDAALTLEETFSAKLVAVEVGAIILLAFGLASFAAIRVVRPFRDLGVGVCNIAAGQLEHRITVVRDDEIGLVAKEFNAITRSLRHSYRDLRRRYLQLTNLYKVSKAVGTTQKIDDLLSLSLRQSLDLIGADTGSIMLLNRETQELEIKAAEGLDDWTVGNARVKLGEGISGQVAQTGKPLIISDGVRKSRVPGVRDVEDALCVPLISNEKIIGVLNANNKRSGRFDRHDLRFFTTMAGQVAVAIANTGLVHSIRSAYFNTIKVLAAAIDAKDRYTHGHSERVAQYAVTIARQLGLPVDDLTRIEAAAYLHDIGKIGVPDNVLNKDGSLTEEEFGLIKQHPVKAAEILGHIDFPWGDVIPGVRGHHERYDGRGYPDGLAGEAISRDARIIAVADSFDAMTSDRPYRKALERTKAITELVKGRYQQFDGEAVDAFIPALLTEWMSSLPGGLADQLEFTVQKDAVE